MYDVTYLIICTIFVANDNEFDVLLKLSFNIIYIDTPTHIYLYKFVSIYLSLMSIRVKIKSLIVLKLYVCTFLVLATCLKVTDFTKSTQIRTHTYKRTYYFRHVHDQIQCKSPKTFKKRRIEEAKGTK